MSTTILTHPNGHQTGASNPAPTAPTTHEAFIHTVRVIVLPRVSDPARRARLADAKLVYGAGHAMGARGVTFYGAWANGTRFASPPTFSTPRATGAAQRLNKPTVTAPPAGE